MKTLGLWFLLLVVFLAVHDTDAWWNRRVSDWSKRVNNKFRRTWTKIKNRVQKKVDYTSAYIKGSRAMYKAYREMREARFKGAHLYFYAKGNFEAQKFGPGGKAAAKTASNARARLLRFLGRSYKDIAEDQKANLWGRNGGNPNKYRPKGLPSKY